MWLAAVTQAAIRIYLSICFVCIHELKSCMGRFGSCCGFLILVVMLCVVCIAVSWTFLPSEPLFTALPRFPLFFPHDLVFNMDADKCFHASLFMLLKNKSDNIPRDYVAWNPQSRLPVVLYWSLNIYFLRRRSAFSVKSPKQYENRRGMASVRGPGGWITSSQSRTGRSWRMGVGSVIGPTNHRVWIAKRRYIAGRIVLSFTLPVCGHRGAFPALVHGGRTGGIVGKFRRLVYKLVFTQYALFPQPCLREGVTGSGRESEEKWKILLFLKIKLTSTESKCLCYH